MEKIEKISMKPQMVFSPQPMYIIGTRNENGTANFCIITWIGFSFDKTPHLMMFPGNIVELLWWMESTAISISSPIRIL